MTRRPALSSARSQIAALLAEFGPSAPPPVVVRRRRELRVPALPQVPAWAPRAAAAVMAGSATLAVLSVAPGTVAQALELPAPAAAVMPPSTVPQPSREERAAEAVRSLPDIPAPPIAAAPVTVQDRALVPVSLPGWKGVGELWSAVVPGQEGRAVVILPIDPVAAAGLVGNGWAQLADGSTWRVSRIGSATESDLSALTDVVATVPLLTLVSGIAGDPRPFIELRKVAS